MNIIILVDLVKNGFGGGVYSVFKFGQALSEIGNRVYMFWVNFPWFYNSQFKNDKLRIKKRPSCDKLFKGSGYIDGFLEIIYSYIDIHRFLNKCHKDVDWVIGHQTKTAIRAAQLGKKYDIATANFIFETPNWLSKEGFEEWHRKWRHSNVRKIWGNFQKSLQASSVIFPNSELTKKEAEIWLDRTIAEPIYPGIEIFPSLDHMSSNNRCERQIMYIGRLKKHKNVHEVIEALSKIQSLTKLIICGSGPEKMNLIALAKKMNINCEFKGTITDTEKWKLISESKFMIFPSSFEGFGIPPMEALACGIPCICSDIPIFHEVYGDKVEYFKEHNVKQLAEKIQYLLDNSDYCKKRGSEGRKYVSKKFSWEKSAQKLEEILYKHVRKIK